MARSDADPIGQAIRRSGRLFSANPKGWKEFWPSPSAVVSTAASAALFANHLGSGQNSFQQNGSYSANEALDVAQQLHAVENAITQAKRTLIQDHLDHCLEEAVGTLPRDQRDSIEAFKSITKYL